MAQSCPACGTKAPYEGAKYCPECGTKLGEGAVSSKDRLVKSLAGERGPQLETDRLSFDPRKIPFGPARFEAAKTAEAARFVRLPDRPDDDEEAEPGPPWRILLISANRDLKPLGLEIRGEVIVGRKMPGSNPDLDLSPYGGVQLGVSRRHALLRPSKAELLVVDLVSSNGTYCNGSKLDAGMPRALKDLDVLSFGGVHFLYKVVNEPGDGAPPGR